ncbi:MAG TPA: hypothetical protein VN495_02665, partial [Candidatus Paceibacterota bacterium]|nr:hypothetical protein [Candidatus Paceibacterota bacterium]
MQVHKPVTDAGLIFGSIFVAVSIVGIGILGDQHAPDQMAFIAPTAMTAMAAAPAGVTKEQQAYCTTGTKNTADALQSNCVPGCEYQVLEHGSSPLITVIKGPNPVPKAGSTEKLPPGSVTYVVGSMGGPNPGGGSSDPSTYGPMTCVAGKSGAPPSIGGAINQSQYGSSIGAHLQGDTATFQGQSSSAPGVTPASAPASSAAQGQPSATSPC